MSDQINFNGKAYKSIEEMPPDVRRAYEQIMSVFADKDHNGVPDNFEGFASVGTQNINLQTSNIFYEGRLYHSVEELPAEARQKYDQAMGKLDANRNGIPDFMEGLMSSGAAISAEPDVYPDPQPSPPQALPSSPTIEPEGIGGKLVIVALLLAGLLCALAAGILIFLRQ